MPTNRFLVLAVLLASTLAGCVSEEVDPPGEGPDDPGAPPTTGGGAALPLKPADANSLEKQLKAIQIVPEGDLEWQRPNLTKRDWLLLSTPMTPEGSVTAFAWEYPVDAVVRDGNTDADVVSLDFAIALDPMGSPAGLVEGIDWALLAFHERLDPDDGWETALAGFRIGMTQETTVWTAGGSPTTTTGPASSEPFAIPVPAGGEDTGAVIYLVLAARGPAGSAFGVGARALPQEFAGAKDSPTADWADFLSLVDAEDRVPVVPERVAEGDGLFLGLYSERIFSAQAGIIERAIVDMPPPQEVVPPELAEYISSRSTTITSDVSWGGLSLVDIGYTNIPDVSLWEVSGNINGEEAGVSAFVDNTAKSCRAMIEGDAGSSLENTITNPWTLAAELLRYQHFSIGLQMEPITGLPLRTVWGC